jgi:hypothetical protein
MFSRKDFLALVLPPLEEGESYCTVGIKDDGENKDVRQRFVGSIDEICQHADEFVAGTYNGFFALSKYGAENRRTTSNAVALKAFFVDLDCGPGKPFGTLAEGMTALRAFCKAAGMPKPTVVQSGMGAHIYWPLEKAIPRERWVMHAERLKELCVEHKFDVDPAVTADVARILRIPETMHVKDPTNPIPVVVMSVSKELTLEQVDALLAPSLDILASASKADFKRQLDPLTLSLMGNNQSRFKTILTKSLEGKGCAQLAHIYTNQAELEEPMWRAGLSIAQVCLDRDKAIHILSQKHPGYSAEATERKAEETKGPYTCETFKKLNPSLCEGCPLKLTSPIQLGKEVVEATEEDNVVIAQEEITKEDREYVIPKYPFPFFRGKNGGVYMHSKNKADEDFDELIYPYDFYVVKRMMDPDVKETMLLRFHTPRDGVRDFILPTNVTVAKDKFMSMIAEQGIAVLGKKQDHIMAYVNAWLHELMKEKAEKAHRQFGWTEGEGSIIIGDREIKATEIAYSPPSAPTLNMIPWFQTKGDFHTWKEIINHYGNPGMEARAFAFFLGFGTPLMRFTALEGFLVNLVSRDSGTGKTTLLHAINSIYGRPRELTLSPKDTYNVRMHRLGIMQNLAVTMDEITNMAGDQMSNQIYDVTSGRGKNRMKQHENSERSNDTKFQTGMISSSNRYVSDVLLSVKGFPDGEFKRILEIPIEPEAGASATWSRNHFERLVNNYGHAIQPYAQSIIGQLPAVKETLNKVRDKVDIAAELRPSERYWGLILSLAITGGTIAKQLGLHDIPIKPVFEFGIEAIKKARIKSKSYVFDNDEFLSIFLGDHYHEILIINGHADKRTGVELGPIKEPRGRLSVRYEPDTKIMYVSTSVFRKECETRVLNYDETIRPYIKNKSLIMHPGNNSSKRKRMFVGTSASNTAGTMCLWFDTTKLDFFDEKVLMSKDTDENSESSNSDKVG